VTAGASTSAGGTSDRGEAAGGVASGGASGGADGRASRGAGAARVALLDRCVAFLQEGGFGDLSLREIAAGVGTSHRMLIYHFGSRDGLLAAIVGRIEADQRVALDALASSELPPEETATAFWRHVADPSLAPAVRLFFEIYVQAVRGRDWTDGFRRAVIDAWEEPLTEAFAGLPDARARARLSLAVGRGLLLDLLLTGDRAAVDAADALFVRMVTAAADRGN
jgi:AcrR family transcriptional regulator